MISYKILFIATILSFHFLHASPISKDKESKKRSRKGGRDGSCSKEECIEGLKNFKISGDCIRAPFCIRQVVRDLKKLDREKTTMESNYLNEMENIKQLREENENLLNQQNKDEWKTKYNNLDEEFQILKNSEALLRQTNLGMEAKNKAIEKRNQRLENKFKDMKQKLEEIEKHSSSIIAVNAEKEELETALDEMKKKHKIQEERIGDIVKSLELIETQNALNSQNLSEVMKENLELKSAMGVLKSQNDHLKSKEAELKLESKESKQNYTDCKDSIDDLKDVNSQCKTKIKELNLCKGELSKLSTLIEEKLQTIQVSEKTASSAKQRSNILEKDLEEAKNKIDGFVTNLDKKSRDIEDLQSKLNVCEGEQKQRLERKTEEETKIPQNCESPCTISRNTANDFITSGENKELKEATDNLKIDNEILNKKIENLESSLAECQNKENLEPSESKTARERIIKDLLS